MLKHVLPVPLLLLLCCSCGTTRFVKPLAKRQQAVNLSLGGPLIGYNNLTIPVPFLTAVYGYGIDSTLTGFGGVNVTSAIYGNLQLELGATKRILAQKGLRPALSVSPVINFIYRDADAMKLLPQVDINFYLEGKKHRGMVYAGISNWFELTSKRSTGATQPYHWFLSPEVGYSLNRRRWDLSLELKVLAPGINYESSTVDYKSPFGKHGAFGIYLGYTHKFFRK